MHDVLAAAQPVGAVGADLRDILAWATVDCAVAVVGDDVVVARPGAHDVGPVAGIDPVHPGRADEQVVLTRVVVARIPVAPQDVLAPAAVELVGAVVAEQLVVGRAAGLDVVGGVKDLPQDPGHRGPPGVGHECSAASGLPSVARSALLPRENRGAELLRGRR